MTESIEIPEKSEDFFRIKTEESFEKKIEDYFMNLKLTLEKPHLLPTIGLKENILKIMEIFNNSIDVSDIDPFESNDVARENINKCLRLFLNNDLKFNKKKLLLLGPSGCGKTSIIQKLYIQIIRARQKHDDPFPILIDLSNRLNINMGLTEHDLSFEMLKKDKKINFVFLIDNIEDSCLADLNGIERIFSILRKIDKKHTAIVTCKNESFLKLKQHKIFKTNKFKIKYINHLSPKFFLDKNFTEYLKIFSQAFKKHKKISKSFYIKKIKDSNLRDLIKTNLHLAMVLSILPLLENHKETMTYSLIYHTYYRSRILNFLKKRKEYETNETNEHMTDFFFNEAIYVAELMMIESSNRNILGGRTLISYLKEKFPNYNYEKSFLEQEFCVNFMKILGLVASEKKDILKKGEFNVTLSFEHETFKNYLLSQGFVLKIARNQAFPSWISEKVIIENHDLMKFLVERIKQEYKLVTICKNAIKLTKEDDDIRTINLAVNLISLLVASNVSFNSDDLSHIKIPGANLSDGIFTFADFSYADLSNVKINNAKIDYANFFKTKLTDLHLNEYPKLYAHKNCINSLCFSPDGNKLVSGSSDGLVKIWDMQTLKEIMVIEPKSGYVFSTSFSHSGEKIIVGTKYNKIIIYNVKHGHELKRLEGHRETITTAVFSKSDSMIASGSNDKTVKLWDYRSATLIHNFFGHDSIISVVAFAPDEKRIASGSSDKTIKVWNISNGQIIFNFDCDSKILMVSFFPNGNKIISGSKDRRVRVWCLKKGEIINSFRVNFDFVNAFANSLNCDKVMASGEGKSNPNADINIWDVKRRKILNEYGGMRDLTFSLAFSPKGNTVAFGNNDKSITIKNIIAEKQIKNFEGPTNPIKAVFFSKKGDNLIGVEYKTIRFWNIKNGKEVKTINFPSSQDAKIFYQPDIRKVIVLNNKKMRIWGEKWDHFKKVKVKYNMDVTLIVMSPNNDKLLISDSSLVTLWDIKMKKKIKKIEIQKSKQILTAFSPNGDQFILGGKDHIFMWNATKIKKLKTFLDFDELNQNYNYLQYSTKGDKILSIKNNRKFIIWNAKNGKLIKKYHINGTISSIFTFTFKFDKFLCVDAEGTLQLRSVDFGNILQTFNTNYRSLGYLSFSHSGDKFVCHSNINNSLSISNVEDGECYPELIISGRSTNFSYFNTKNIEEAIDINPRILKVFQNGYSQK